MSVPADNRCCYYDSICDGDACRPHGACRRPTERRPGQTPSVFRANRQPEATLQCFGLGGIDELPTPGRDQTLFNNLGAGLGGTVQTLTGYAAPLPYDRCPLRTPNKTPSRFVCNSVNCGPSLYYDEGWINMLPKERVIPRSANCCRTCKPCRGTQCLRRIVAYDFGHHGPAEPY